MRQARQAGRQGKRGARVQRQGGRAGARMYIQYTIYELDMYTMGS